MRFDRLITLSVVQPLRHTLHSLRITGSYHSIYNWPVPILMYHSISNDAEPRLSPYYKVNTSPTVFREHIGFLAKQNYRSIDLMKVIDLSKQGTPLPEKSVVITFDDGFRNFYTDAFPVLQQYGFSATVFLPTAFIQNTRQVFKEKECLTWAEVRELRQCGVLFGSHTVTHPRLVDLSWNEIKRELYASKQELEQRLGESISTFAYPYAFPQADQQYMRGIKTLLAESGYKCCATTEIGRVKRSDDPFRLKRLPVNSLDDPVFFKAKLNGGYDWLAHLQTILKQIKKQPRCKPLVNQATAPSADFS